MKLAYVEPTIEVKRYEISDVISVDLIYLHQKHLIFNL